MEHIPVVLVQELPWREGLFDFVWYQSHFLRVNLWLRLSCAQYKVNKSSEKWRKELSVIFICSCTFAFKIRACRWDTVNAAPSLLDLLTFLKWKLSEINSPRSAQAVVKEILIPCFTPCLRVIPFSWWFWGFCLVFLQWEVFPLCHLWQQVNGYCKTFSGKQRAGKVSLSLPSSPGRGEHNLWHLLQ